MKKKTLPTPREITTREIAAAYLVAGSVRKASALLNAQGRKVSYRAVAERMASPEGKAALEDVRGKEGLRMAERLERIVGKQLEQYEAALDAGAITARDLPIHAGIYMDKLARMKAPVEDPLGGGDPVVVVKFGGRRVDPDGAETAAAVEVQVNGRKADGAL